MPRIALGRCAGHADPSALTAQMTVDGDGRTIRCDPRLTELRTLRRADPGTAVTGVRVRSTGPVCIAIARRGSAVAMLHDNAFTVAGYSLSLPRNPVGARYSSRSSASRTFARGPERDNFADPLPAALTEEGVPCTDRLDIGSLVESSRNTSVCGSFASASTIVRIFRPP